MKIKVVNTKKWQGEGEYIGRGTPLGNPFVMENEADRAKVIAKYDIWIASKMSKKDPNVMAELKRLYAIAQRQTLVLICWCKPKKCHGDVIKAILEGWNHNNYNPNKSKGGDMIKVIVAGSRGLSDYDYVKDSLNAYLEDRLPDVEIVSGTAQGADRLGERYAKEMRLNCKQFPAQWDKYGKSAGYRRNEQMAAYADAAIIFWDGRSKGSKHMADIAEKAGLIVRVDEYTDDDPEAERPHETRLGPAIAEICKWDRKMQTRIFSPEETPWETFRARIKSAPTHLNGNGEYYLRHVMQNGIWLSNTVELVAKKFKVTRNTDLPDTLPLDEMGVPGPSNREDYVWPAVDPNAPPYRKSAHLDADKQEFLLNGNKRFAFTRTVGGMNDRDFRERCVQANGKLYVLYPMGLPEVSPPNHLRAETINRWLAGPCRCKRECEHLKSVVPEYDADSIVKALSKLQMDRTATTKMMFGYMANDEKQWRPGVKSMDTEEIAELAWYLEDLEAKLPKLTPEGEDDPVQLDDYRAYYLDVSQKLVEMGISSTGDGLPYDLTTWKGQMNYIEDMARRSLAEEPDAEPHPAEIDWLIRKGFSVEEDPEIESENQAYEDSDFKPVGDGWTAFPLHYGEDTVDWSWISCIRTAGVRRLQAWKRAMGKLWYLTYQQRSDLWNRIWERQDQLVAQIGKKVDRTVKDIVDEMRGLNENQAKALIYAYQVGGSFNAFNMFDFDAPGDPELVFWLWDYYRKTYK